MVWAILMTSLGVTVGMNTDLTGVTQALNSRTFRTFELFALAGVNCQGGDAGRASARLASLPVLRG